MSKTREQLPASFRILNDDEFARLMIAEYSDEQRRHGFVSKGKMQFQTALLAASFLVFILAPGSGNLSLEDEFSVPAQIPDAASAPVLPVGRNKSGGASVLPLPKIEAEFSRVEADDSTNSQQERKDVVSLRIKTQNIRSLRVEIHENGKLKLIRLLDLLTPPLEQFHTPTVSGNEWSFVLEDKTPTLICVKAAEGPKPPDRLSDSEMKTRSERFNNQCSFWSR
ncbi:hypothetical protein EBR21_17640 [bacterium]|nr:hypothetical protein [bacterium]